MKIGSLTLLVGLLGCTSLMGACSSDSAPAAGSDASAGGSGGGDGGKAGGGTGGKAGGGTGGKAGGDGGAPATGGKATGGSGGEAPIEAGVPDASMDSGSPEAGADASDAAGDGAANCANSRCVAAYFDVQYPAQNQPTAEKAMLGKFLFWDEQMGELDANTCGTCHRSHAGGSDPRTNDFDQTAHAVLAHLPGPDGIVDTNPSITSDDIRGAAGVPLCSSPTTITGTVRQVTTRKPPSYFDAMFAPRVFWDGRAGDCKAGDGNLGGCFYDPDTLVLNPSAKPLVVGVFDAPTGRVVGAALEQQSVGPPVNSKEMACSDQTWAKIEAKLARTTPLLVPLGKAKAIPQDMKDFEAKYTTYPAMFQAAFGSTAKVNAGDPDTVINSQRIAFAIATHERRLTSNETPWDKWRAGDDSAMTPQQIRGYVAFMGPGQCGRCHAPPLFTDLGFHNIGFHKPAWDPGRKGITNVEADATKFKTPTLRNVGLREPFGLLHEGEGPGHDLLTVMQLYRQGGFPNDPDIGPFIDPQLTPLKLTQGDVDDIIEFLRHGLTDPRVDAETAPFDRPHLSTEPQ